ncbi:uncharacterized protein C8Q71DRAFT_720353 [Rhodofomes roseus]|uniref:Uncharacterized protein n=1 Tax=Rhodofomes roseus TaxID=34475 RepID=A0ABQ8KV97_9APHY|nr:uncharacterized protein C8Q71DRAFT_720353 [Rhodofomes roseus]KAH9842959.1 hypothetical protein C8Q71DRAFT_720353 [Rhodofomes roseus]
MSDDELQPQIDVRQLTSDDVHTVKLLIMARGPGPINLTLKLCNHDRPGREATTPLAQFNTLQQGSQDDGIGAASGEVPPGGWPVDSQGLPTTQAMYAMASLPWPPTSDTPDAGNNAPDTAAIQMDTIDDSATETDSQAPGVLLVGNIIADRRWCNHLKHDASIAEGTNGKVQEGLGGPGIVVDAVVPMRRQEDWPPSPAPAVRDLIDNDLPAPWHTPRAVRVANANILARDVTPPPAEVPDPRTPSKVSGQYGTEAWHQEKVL